MPQEPRPNEPWLTVTPGRVEIDLSDCGTDEERERRMLAALGPWMECVDRRPIVRFTRGPLGLVAHGTATHFEPEKVQKGDTGRYVGRHPTLDDWHLIAVWTERGRELLCPAHEGQFEPTVADLVPDA